MDVTLPGPEREEPVATHRAEGLLQRMTALLCNAVPVKLAFA